MSVRTEPKDLSAQLQQTLTIPADVMQQAGNPAMVGAPMGGAPEVEQALHGANDFNTNSPDHPLSRTVVVNIRSSLSDLCLRGAKAIWAPPNTEATKAIFQQARRCLIPTRPMALDDPTPTRRATGRLPVEKDRFIRRRPATRHATRYVTFLGHALFFHRTRTLRTDRSSVCGRCAEEVHRPLGRGGAPGCALAARMPLSRTASALPHASPRAPFRTQATSSRSCCTR